LGWYGDIYLMSFAIGDIVEVALRGRWLDNTWMNVWQYRIDVTSALITAENLGEGWWNHVKATYRGLAPDTVANCFIDVLVRSLMSPTADYGVYAIGAAETDGSRSTAGIGDPQASFVGVGVKLAVGTRTTRPGSKRFPFLYEADSSANILAAGITAGVVAHMDVMVADMTLGAPAATMVLQPHVVKKDAAGLALVWQPITSYAVNGYTSSQVSRKQGRGI